MESYAYAPMTGRTLVRVVLALAAAKLALDHISDPDLFWHIRLGVDILDKHALPTTVEHAWTAVGAPYIANDWGSEVLLALLFRLGGMPVLAVAKAIIAATIALAIFSVAFRRADGNLAAAGVTAGLLVIVGSTQLLTRPGLLGNLCLAIEVIVLDQVRAGRPRRALLLPAIFVAWVNLHGSWPIGFGPLAASVAPAFLPFSWGRWKGGDNAPESRRWIAAGFGLSILAPLLNPVGASFALRPFRLVGHGAELGMFDEWRPAPWTSPGAWALVVSGLVLVLASAKSRRPLEVFEFAVIALVFGLSLKAARFHLPYAIIAAPILGEHLGSAMREREAFRRRGVNIAIALAAFLSLGVVAAARVAFWRDDLERTEPARALSILRHSPLAGSKGFNFYDWGGYVLFCGVDSFIDGRLEPFIANGVFAHYLELERSGDAAALERDGVQWLLEPPDHGLISNLARQPGWRVAYQDEQSELLLHSDRPGADSLIENTGAGADGNPNRGPCY
jgi:hypothetical protein